MNDGFGSDAFPRRTVLKAGLAVGLSGLLLPALGGCTPGDRQAVVTVAGGEPGGFYLEFAGLLAESLQRHGVADRATALTTGGSRSDADAGTVKKTVEILVDHAEELVPRSSLGIQFLSPESLINTPGLSLHPAVAAAYRELHG
jgi:hypothetical protein